MFEQIDGENEIVSRFKESASDRGWYATIVGAGGSILAVALVVLVLALASGIGMTDADDATRVLGDSGFRSIKITGYKFFGCGDSDFFHTGFSAISPSGRRVTGVVCKGIIKKNTVRID